MTPYHLEIQSANNAKAKAAVAKAATDGKIPEALVAPLQSVIDTLPVVENTVVYVRTNGTLDADVAAAINFDVRLIELA